MVAKIFVNIVGQIFTILWKTLYLINKERMFFNSNVLRRVFKMKGKLGFSFVFLLVFGFSSFSCFAQSSNNDQRIVGTWICTYDNGTATLVFNANGSGTYSWTGSDPGSETFTYGISLSDVIYTTYHRTITLYFSPDGRTLIFDGEIYRKR
jgi:hypothetical protein